MPCFAQRPNIRYLFPAGGQRGTTVDVTVYGAGLQNASMARVIPADLSATVKRATSAGQATVTLQIPPTAALGEHVLRLVAPGGATNQFRFLVGQFPEVQKNLNNTTPEQAQLLSSLPVLVNGQIEEGRRDYYRFTCKSGQNLVCAIDARTILPYIADAVPGWLDATLTLFDSRGKKVASVDDYRFSPDPVLICKIPADGEFTLEVRDILDRGRADFVYRLSIGELPWITSIYPLGGRRGTPLQVSVQGVNVSGKTIAVPASQEAAQSVFLNAGSLESNRRPFATGLWPEREEQEPNDSQQAANRVEAPVTINGHIDHPDDADWFVFHAQKQQTLVMEVRARRLESPVDSILTLFDAKGARLAENDDTVDPSESLLTHHADSRIVHTFPAEGDYYLRMRDIQGKGGEEYAYRLTIAPPEPDFALTVMPDGPVVAKGDSTVVMAILQRRDGFNGDVEVSVSNLPPGFTASQAVLSGSDTTAPITITAPAQTDVPCFAPTIAGTARIGSATVTHTAVGTERLMQAFSLTFFPTTREALCSVVPGGAFSLAEAAPRSGPLEARLGTDVKVVVKVIRALGIAGPVTLQQAIPVAGIEARPATIPAGADTAEVTIHVMPFVSLRARPNVILTGTMPIGAGSITRILQAIPLKILPAP